MLIDLSAFVQCIHCHHDTPQGRFCAHCGKPLIQVCPYPDDDTDVSLMNSIGKPTCRCPGCRRLFKVCPLCKRLYRAHVETETHCVTDGFLLYPTTALEDGAFGGSRRNAARCWYINSLNQANPTALPDIHLLARQAAYAAEQLVICGISSSGASGAGQLRIHAHPSLQTPPVELQMPAPPAQDGDRDTLLLFDSFAGVLHTQSATLFRVQAPAQKVHDMPLASPPRTQAFSQNHWWVASEVNNNVHLTCYDITTRQTGKLMMSVPLSSVRRMIATPRHLVIVCRNLDIYQITAGTMQQRMVPKWTAEADSAMAGAAYDEQGLLLLLHSPRYVSFYRWRPDTDQPQRVHTLPLTESGVSGPILSPQAIYFYGPRTLYAFQYAAKQLLSQPLPGTAEPIEASVVVLESGEHLLLRRRLQNMDQWTSWTPGSEASFVTKGQPFKPSSLSGLTDNGYYQITPSANQGGGSATCEMRLWQFS